MIGAGRVFAHSSGPHWGGGLLASYELMDSHDVAALHGIRPSRIVLLEDNGCRCIAARVIFVGKTFHPRRKGERQTLHGTRSVTCFDEFWPEPDDDDIARGEFLAFRNLYGCAVSNRRRHAIAHDG